MFNTSLLAKPAKLFLLFICLYLPLTAQTALLMHQDAIEIISSQQAGLEGILSTPQFSPYPSKVFSFERHYNGNQFLYFYDLAARSLTEVRTVLRNTGYQISAEDSLNQSIIFNSQLNWSPKLDSHNRQWFTFISNGTDNNRDIYIGFVGGSSYIRLTNDPLRESNPVWSPDGKSIAFISARSGNGDIYLLNQLDLVIEDVNRDLSNIQITQLTNTPLEENMPTWNPAVSANLLAYAEQTHYEGRTKEPFQIRILDLNKPDSEPLHVTDDFLAHYTRPQWDTINANKLIFIQKSITDDRRPKLFVSEFEWSKDDQLQNKVLDEYKTEVFDNVFVSYIPEERPAVWLAGSEGLICQEDLAEQNFPLYTVNVEKWLKNENNARNYAEEIHYRYPYIQAVDARKNNLLFVSRTDTESKIYLAKITGDDVRTDKSINHMLAKDGSAINTAPPRKSLSEDKTDPGGNSKKGSKKVVWVVAGAATLGTAAYFLWPTDDTKVTEFTIGSPPGAPGDLR